MKGTQEEWHTECPHCHTYSYIHFNDVKFDKEEFKDENGEKNYNVSNSRWQCPICKRETPEYEVKRLPAKWVTKNERALANGVRSFRLSAFMSPWSDWNDIALSFLQAKDDPERLKVWHNTMLGESWEMKDRSETPEQLYDRREHYTAEVPDGVVVLTMGVDTQDNRLEYEVVGWSREEESWGISRGIIPGRPDAPGVWEEIDALLDREWKMKNGMRLRIGATFVDSGGHFTEQVYKECAKREVRRVFAIKGEAGDSKTYVRLMKKSDSTIKSNKFMIAVDGGKEAIMYATSVEKPGPRYMHFPMDYRCGYDLEFFRGLCSEKMIIKRQRGQNVLVWEKTYERNEPLDCRNYAMAAYRYFKWPFDKIEATLRGDEITAPPITQKQAEKKKQRRVISSGIKL